MADSTTRQMKNLIRKVKKVSAGLVETKLLDDAAKDGVQIITQRSRNGFGLSKNGKNLKNLKNKKSTVKKRETLEKDGKLSNKTSARITNLTRGGSLLNNLTTRRIKRGIVEIKTGSREDNEKAKKLEALGQKFMGLTTKEAGAVTRKLANSLVERLNRLFN